MYVINARCASLVCIHWTLYLLRVPFFGLARALYFCLSPQLTCFIHLCSHSPSPPISPVTFHSHHGSDRLEDDPLLMRYNVDFFMTDHSLDEHSIPTLLDYT